MLAVCAIAAQAQKSVVWEQPKAFMGQCVGEFFITKVELKQTETIMHLTVHYPPHNWIRFDKYSFLLTPDGKRYTITGGAKTNDEETDLTPDSLFWMPESGMSHLALHFEPVPLDTKVMDFLESYQEQDFKFWNICDSKTKQKLEIPAVPRMVNTMIMDRVTIANRVGESTLHSPIHTSVARIAPAVPGPQGQNPVPNPVPITTEMIDGFPIQLQQ